MNPLLLLFAFSFTWHSTNTVREHKEKKGKVVLIHSIINHRSMHTFKRIMKKNDWDVEQWKYPSLDDTIEAHAKSLVNRLKKIKKDDEPINFVAFSMGGLVLRAALNDPECPKEAFKGKIVVISSPLRGSKAARIAGKLLLGRKILGNHSGRQLHETAHNGFAHHGDFPENIPMLVISGSSKTRSPFLTGRSDGIVSAHETCPDVSHQHRYVQNGHKFMCQNIHTIDAALNFLESKDPPQNCQLKKSV